MFLLIIAMALLFFEDIYLLGVHVHACPLHVGLFVCLFVVSATTLESPLPLYHTMQQLATTTTTNSHPTPLPPTSLHSPWHSQHGGAVGFPLCKRTKFVSCRVLYNNNNNSNCRATTIITNLDNVAFCMTAVRF